MLEVTANVSKEPTTEQFAHWEEKFGFLSLTIRDRQCWIRYPGVEILRKVMTRTYTTNEDFEKEMLRQCWLTGDRIILETEELMNDLRFQAIGKLQAQKCPITKEGKLFRVVIADKTCLLKNPTMFDLLQARHTKKKPFEMEVFLLKRIWFSGDKSILSNEWYYLSLLTAIEKIHTRSINS